MQETLLCSQCSKKWKRETSRGRKPVICPKCLAKNSKPTKPIQKKKPVSVKTKKVVVSEPEPQVFSSRPDRAALAAIYKSLYPKPDRNNDQLKDQGNTGSVWKCLHCNYILKIGVTLTDIPTHKCSEHSVRVRDLKRIS